MMQTKVVGLISKSPEKRGDSDIRAVLPWLRKKSDLLNSSGDDILMDVVRNCAYRRALRDDVIVTQGDRGNCFFIMLSGKTSVFIDTAKSDDDTLPESVVISDEKPTEGQDLTTDDDDDSVLSGETLKKRKPLKRSKYGKFMIHYEAGSSFGEIALISEDSVRNATVISDEETDLLVIYRDLFNRSMKAKQEKEYEERKEFIARFKLFSDWSAKFKHLLEMSVRKEEYPYGSHIIKQGEPVAGLFFIVSGQAKVTIDPSQHHNQYPHMLKRMSPIEKELGRQNKENIEKKIPGSFTQCQIRIRRKQGYAAAEKRYMSKSVELCCVEGTEIQGDLEMVMEMSTSCCTVTSTANTTVFILDNKNFDRLVLKKNAHTVNKLREGVLRKLQNRIATPNGSLVPLLKAVHDDLQESLEPKQKASSHKLVLQKDKQNMTSQMIQLYLKDKTPLIDPVLPDSFYYRLMTEKRSKIMASRDQRRRERERLYNRAKRRMPRSLKQLQNSAAETELMNPTRVFSEYTQTSPKTVREKIIRPRTAIGIESYSTPDFGNRDRPETASGRLGGRIFHLTECDVTEEQGDSAAIEKVVPVTEEVGHVVHQIDTFQRDKNEIRSKVVCATAVKTELKTDLERAHIHKTVEDFYDAHDEDYFDYETSATNLRHLEDRIKTFCSKVGQRRLSDPFKVNELRCFHVEGSSNVPLAGGTVLVKKKPCVYPPNVKIGRDVHQHIRRFMINRVPTTSYTSISGRPKSAFSAISRSKHAW